ncbi:thermonuclease family protein [Nafulsella turpanensis]|uniref:thermonuclease family protein n=1 Tax=Nafulsella turpanensis TaxID=1265690 RepID=UPI00034DAFB0|nr:thermonuclease family protein [Nafulsella turpanensis]
MKPLFTFLLILFYHSVWAQEYSGRVVAISDGDTFTFLASGNRQIKVRLAEVDTPERSQPYGKRAKEALSSLIFGQEIRVQKADVDRYGRLVGHVYFGKVHVNRKMVQDGMAWVYRQYMQDKRLLLDEQQARESGLGLWSLPISEQVPPWEWRRGVKSKAKAPVVVQAKVPKDFTCEGKTTCGEMVSCEEAMFYFENCGLTRLDRDKDGIPCESICN